MSWSYIPITSNTLIKAEVFTELRNKLNDLLDAFGVTQIRSDWMPNENYDPDNYTARTSFLSGKSAAARFYVIDILRDYIEILIPHVYYWDNTNSVFYTRTVSQTLNAAFSRSSWYSLPRIIKNDVVQEIKDVIQYIADNGWVSNNMGVSGGSLQYGWLPNGGSYHEHSWSTTRIDCKGVMQTFFNSQNGEDIHSFDGGVNPTASIIMGAANDGTKYFYDPNVFVTYTNHDGNSYIIFGIGGWYTTQNQYISSKCKNQNCSYKIRFLSDTASYSYDLVVPFTLNGSVSLGSHGNAIGKAIENNVSISYNDLDFSSGTGYNVVTCNESSLTLGTPSIPGADMPTWSSSTAYAVGDCVVLSGVYYRCILANTNQQPPNATYWVQVTEYGWAEPPTNDESEFYWTTMTPSLMVKPVYSW